jgi:DNA-binding LacI/PurR family transcriptional regulator
LSEVARRAGVSKATASRALSDRGRVAPETRDRVRQAALDLGFVASSSAASLVTGRTRTVGVVTPHINRWYFAEVLEGVEERLIEAGSDLTLYRLSERPDQRRRVFEYFLRRKRVDAVVTIGVALTTDEVAMLHSLRRPILGLGGAVDGITTMSLDDVAASRLATEHLLSLGHRRIVHLGGGHDEQPQFHAHAARLEGFRAALSEAEIESEGDDLRVTPYTIPGGYEAALELLAHPRDRPTAIVAGCDEIAIGVITAARQLGIHVPAELSVVGIDDHSLAAMFGLTTVRHDPRAQGRQAVDAVLAEADRELLEPARALTIPMTLRVRSSTTAPARDRNPGARRADP